MSSAGPAPAAQDGVRGPEPHVGDCGGLVNPCGMDWEACAFVPWTDGQRLERLYKRWRGEDVDGHDGDGAVRGDLDHWQAFAYDVVEHHDMERERLEARASLQNTGSSTHYKPLRLFLTGKPGAGKSLVVRSFVRARRASAHARGVAKHVSRGACVLAAPTGCASFQMKFGAATIHRTFGIPVGYCGPARNKHSATYLKRMARLKSASLFVVDEFSMVGRGMPGKVVYKTKECLGGAGTMGGRDVI